MNQTGRFCRQCGQPLQAGVVFCPNCGTQSAGNNVSGAAPASTNQSPYPMPQAQPATYTQPQKERKPIAPKVILIVVGVLLLLFAIRAPAALLFGQSTMARIDSVDRVYNRSQDSLEYNYRVTYVFNDGDRQRSSNYDMPRTYNVARLPAVGSLIQVKYVSGISFISYPVGIKNTGLGSIITGVIGLGLIFLAFKGNVKGGFVRRR